MRRSPTLLVLAVATLAAACSPSSAPDRSANRAGVPSAAKTSAITTLNQVVGFGPMSGPSPAGGWGPVAEIHSNGLFTTELTTRRVVGLLAERVPSLEDGTISLLDDGRMRVAYSLRSGVTWHDGTPFTAHDLAFSVQLLQDGGLPFRANEVTKEIAAVETPDDRTFIAYFKGPYFEAVSHGIARFWPVPRHILGPAYERYRSTTNPEELINHPYWTSEYVHLGPFRLVSWDPSREIVFQSHPGYFRGEPKVGAVRVQVFLDRNAQMAGLLAGTSDVFFENTLDLEQAAALDARWRGDGGGVTYLKPSNIRILVPQFRPAYQTEPANLDPRGRAALYHALDREELAEGLQVGHRETAACCQATRSSRWDATPSAPTGTTPPALGLSCRRRAGRPVLTASCATPVTDAATTTRSPARPTSPARSPRLRTTGGRSGSKSRRSRFRRRRSAIRRYERLIRAGAPRQAATT
jgi:ABC-type transport system substrate-binding protein